MSEPTHFEIDTSSFGISPDEITKEIVDFSPGHTKAKFSYPNGFWFVLELEAESSTLEISPDWELVQMLDGTLVPRQK